MITDLLLEKAYQLSLQEVQKHQAPSTFHLDLSINQGQILAKKLKANMQIVRLGTILMDCGLGEAMSLGKLPQHIKIGFLKTEKFLKSFPELTKLEKNNIMSCVLEHHGVSQFFSLESEICCNADCYRFVSVKGVLGGMVLGRKMELETMVSLYRQKAEEKWQSLSLDVCKKELKPQYDVIKKFLASFH